MSFGRLLRAPSTLPAGLTNKLKWSRDGRFCAVAHDTSPFAEMYERIGSGTGGIIDHTSYETNAGQAITTGADRIVDFEDLVEDNNGNVTTGAGWNYTAPQSGGRLEIRFKITWQLLLAHTTVARIYRNSSLEREVFGTADTAEPHTQGSASFLVAPGDTVDVRVNISANDSLTATASENWVDITLFDEIQMEAVTPAFPPVNPPGNCDSVAFTPDSRIVVFGGAGTPFTTFYLRTGSAAWATKLTDLSGGDIPAGAVFSADYDPTGEFLLMGHSVSPFFGIWQRSGNTHARFLTPSGGDIPPGTVFATAWHPSGRFFAVGFVSSPRLRIYSYDPATPSMTLLADPATLPTGQVTGLRWSPDGQMLFASHVTSPRITVYQTASTLPSRSVATMDATPARGS